MLDWLDADGIDIREVRVQESGTPPSLKIHLSNSRPSRRVFVGVQVGRKADIVMRATVHLLAPGPHFDRQTREFAFGINGRRRIVTSRPEPAIDAGSLEHEPFS